MSEIDKAIRCMKSYLPDPGWQNEYHCSNCEYYNKECKSEQFHRMAIVALECLKRMDQNFKQMMMDFVKERLEDILDEETKKASDNGRERENL